MYIYIYIYVYTYICMYVYICMYIYKYIYIYIYIYTHIFRPSAFARQARLRRARGKSCVGGGGAVGHSLCTHLKRPGNFLVPPRIVFFTNMVMTFDHVSPRAAENIYPERGRYVYIYT